MSTIISGDAANVSNSLASTVIDATNTTPIVVQTSAPHLYANGDYVSVSGVVGNTGANGLFPITVIDADHFSLTGSVGTGAYVSGGVARDVSLTPQFTIPSDGDVFNAAAFNVAFEALANRTQFINLQYTPLPDIAALTSIKLPTNNLTRYVIGYGVYTFLTTATTGLSPFRLAADDATAGGWVSGTAHETSIVRVVTPGWCPLRATAAAGTPELSLPIGVMTDALMTTTRGMVQFLAVSTGSAIALGFTSSINEYLIDGATLTQIRARFKPNPGHGALPLLMPKFGVVRMDFTNTPTTLLSTGSGLVVDPTTPFGDYNLEHYFTFTPDQNAIINKTAYHYAISAFNEGHTNSMASGGYYSFEITQIMSDARRS